MSWIGTYLILILWLTLEFGTNKAPCVNLKISKIEFGKKTTTKKHNKYLFKRAVVYSRSTSYLDIRVGANLIWSYKFRIETLHLFKAIRLSKPVWEEQRKCVTSCGSYYVKKGGQTIWTSQQMFLFSFPCTLQRDEMFLNMLLQP